MGSAYITGVAGFVGSRLAQSLLDGGWRVYGCDNFLTSSRESIPLGVIWGVDDIRELTSIPKVDIIFHTAAIARSAWPDDCEVLDVNLNGTKRVIELSDDAELIYSSSSMSGLPSANTYAYSKWAAEKEVLAAGGVALRYSNIYGAGQSTEGTEPNVFAQWRKSKQENGWIRVDGKGDQVRDFIHVDDVVYANEFFAKTIAPRVLWGECFDICTGIETSILDLAIEFDAPIKFAPRRPGDPMRIKQKIKPAARQGFYAMERLRNRFEEVL